MNRQYLFSSESVSEGHPDKMADILSDTMLDRFLIVGPRSNQPSDRHASQSLIKIAERCCVMVWRRVKRSSCHEVRRTS